MSGRLAFLDTGPANPSRRLVLAHGAGQPMDAPFMNAVAEGLAGHGIAVSRFEFPYMAERRHSGRKRPPDREAVLLDTWSRAIDAFGAERLAIGGKSMGGRMASMIADSAGVAGLVCLGYPFHPPGRPDRLRTEHLAALRTPTLICQGTRDPMGKREEVAAYALSPQIAVAWLEDGDHGFKPRKASGFSESDHLRTAVETVANFLAGLD